MVLECGKKKIIGWEIVFPPLPLRICCCWISREMRGGELNDRGLVRYVVHNIKVCYLLIFRRFRSYQ